MRWTKGSCVWVRERWSLLCVVGGEREDFGTVNEGKWLMLWLHGQVLL